MKFRSFQAATAVTAVCISSILAAPGYALPAIQDTSGLSPQEVCELVLKPNDPNSQFVTFAENESVGDWVTVGSEVGDSIGDPYGVGTPTYSNIFLDGSFFRNGGSPNVWGGATATQTYPQTGQLFETLLNQERATTFDCVVQKTNPAGTIEPEGLQSTGNSSLETQQVQGENQEVITQDDFIVEGETVYALVCISPNNSTKGKPGTWTGKNGFNAANCPAASAAAGTSFIPSGNAPIL
jgi:hypothetical protein